MPRLSAGSSGSVRVDNRVEGFIPDEPASPPIVDVVHVYLDATVAALASLSLFAGLRMPSLFPRGRAALPLRILGVSPIAMALAEVADIAGELWAVGALELVHAVGEAVFLFLLTLGAILFVRAWTVTGIEGETPRTSTTADEAATLARILNDLVAEFAKFLGKPFTFGTVRRLSQPTLAASPSGVRESLMRRMTPDIFAPQKGSAIWSEFEEVPAEGRLRRKPPSRST